MQAGRLWISGQQDVPFLSFTPAIWNMPQVRYRARTAALMYSYLAGQGISSKGQMFAILTQSNLVHAQHLQGCLRA